MLDGVQQAAAAHAIPRRVPADRGELLAGLALQQRLSIAQEGDEARAQLGRRPDLRELGVTVALDRPGPDATEHPPLCRRDGVRADGRERVGLRQRWMPAKGLRW